MSVAPLSEVKVRLSRMKDGEDAVSSARGEVGVGVKGRDGVVV
jgi:hypothetical protein